MRSGAGVPARLVADVFPIYCAVTVIRAEAQGREISSWSQGRLQEGEAAARPGREPLLVTAMIKQVQGTPGSVHSRHFLSPPLLPFPIPQ